MPDITMCKDTECPRRMTCYRYIAVHNPQWQSFFSVSPRDGDKCDHFWDTRSREQELEGSSND